MRKFDYIISGAGIAGVTIAHHLLFHNKTVLLYDSGENTSSRVAAGLFNPITGRKMVKTWNADLLFPYLIDFYKKIEKLVGAEFLHQMPIYRPFFSVEEQNDWYSKSSDPVYSEFIHKVGANPQFPEKFNDPYGGLYLDKSGWVNISQYLDSSLRYFQHRNGIELAGPKLKVSELVIGKNEVIYKGSSAKKIIFCEGTDLKNNDFFNWLPLQLLKGEILEIILPFESEIIFNRGVFILPIKDKKYKVGSTYAQNESSLEITLQGKQQLESKLRALVKTKYKITKQSAGIRPTTRDRRPFLGTHPEHNPLVIFNGLGTKGVSLAPYLANNLINHLEKQEDLLKEVNIKRFLSLYCR